MENNKPSLTIIVKQLEKVFTNRITNSETDVDIKSGEVKTITKIGYILGYVKLNDLNEKIWYSTYITSKLIWNIKENFEKKYSILLPLDFTWTFRAYNLETKEQGLEKEQFTLNAHEISKIIKEKDVDAVITTTEIS